MTVLTPAHNPAYQSSVKTTYRSLENNFGDGYKQTVPDGLNNIIKEWSLAWDMNEIDADDLEDQLDALKGQPFEWQDPKGVTRSYTCKEHSKSYVSYDNFRVTAVFVESFDL